VSHLKFQERIKRGRVDWVASHLPFGEAKNNKVGKGCEYYGRSKGKLSGKVPHCSFYFVALLGFLLKRFSVKFRLSNFSILRTCPIDFCDLKVPATPLEKSWIRHWIYG